MAPCFLDKVLLKENRNRRVRGTHRFLTPMSVPERMSVFTHMEQIATASAPAAPPFWYRIRSTVVEALTEVILGWGGLLSRRLYGLHSDDHTLIAGIDPNGNEVVLQGFNHRFMLPCLVESCLKTHRLENPDYLVGVLDLRTGKMDWS
jgi:hypothetical protein